jgi:hypothetical protein
MTTTQNITIQQGAAFEIEVDVEAGHAGDTVTAKIREAFAGTLLGTLTGVIAGEVLTLTMDADDTADLEAPDGTAADLRTVVIGVFDAESIDGDANVTRHVEGRVFLSRRAST